MDFIRFCFPFFFLHWLMGYDILPADTIRYAHDIRSYTMGFLPLAKMGVLMGKVANPLFDGTFLRSYALLRNITIFHN